MHILSPLSKTLTLVCSKYKNYLHKKCMLLNIMQVFSHWVLFMHGSTLGVLNLKVFLRVPPESSFVEASDIGP